VPHRDTSVPSEGTILYNPGGPGEAVIAEAADVAEQLAPGLDRRDLLLVDPRGTGRSGAIACSALANIAPLLFMPHERLNAAVGACGREPGPRAGLYGSAAVADDFDAVRAALGVDRVDLWGKSYGVYLMTVYAGRHPEHVRSLVLSGAFPIDFDVWGRDRLAASRRAIDPRRAPRPSSSAGSRLSLSTTHRLPRRHSSMSTGHPQVRSQHEARSGVHTTPTTAPDALVRPDVLWQWHLRDVIGPVLLKLPSLYRIVA
jgi:pimeloyl-ACP methyl ester carboxylesterase